jgi:hypothetical protein
MDKAVLYQRIDHEKEEDLRRKKGEAEQQKLLDASANGGVDGSGDNVNSDDSEVKEQQSSQWQPPLDPEEELELRELIFGMEQLPEVSQTAWCFLAWSLCEANWKPDWARKLVAAIVRKRYVGGESCGRIEVMAVGDGFEEHANSNSTAISQSRERLSKEALIRLAWCFSVLNERPPTEVLEEIAGKELSNSSLESARIYDLCAFKI